MTGRALLESLPRHLADEALAQFRQESALTSVQMRESPGYRCLSGGASFLRRGDTGRGQSDCKRPGITAGASLDVSRRGQAIH